MLRTELARTKLAARGKAEAEAMRGVLTALRDDIRNVLRGTQLGLAGIADDHDLSDDEKAQWKDDRVNELYALERQTNEGEERGKMFKEIEARVHEGAPFIFLFMPKSAYAMRANVEGFEVLPTANYSLKDVVIK